ncbi:DRTGG domain-containing protein [Chloroflexota bacterium]
MVALYVASLKKGSGKTAVCAGLAQHLLGNGKKIGFFKPVIDGSKSTTIGSTDRDAAFMKRLFALEEPVDILCPVFSDESRLRNGIKEAYDKVSRGKDLVIIEGISDEFQASLGVVDTLNAMVIIVEGCSKALLKAINNYKDFGKHLLGIVLNKVPRSQVEHACAEVTASLSQDGISILGLLPEDRSLFALTIGELSEHIQGEIIGNAKEPAELVENFMLGAMSVDSGLEYFGRKANKAVVIRSERPDMQLAALQTSVKCLVLAGNTAPKSVVLHSAEEKNVPVILAKDDITTIVANVEDALAENRFNQENKLPKLTEIMEQHFDFQAVYKGLGLIGS